MPDLSHFPITQRWPVRHPDRIQLFSFPTPNGQKVAITLEELGLPYEAHRVTLSDSDVKSQAFLSLNPNGKIPAILDPDGPDGRPVTLWESGAILLYLSEKTGRLAGVDATERAHVTQWLMWQMGGLGPMLGQLGYFSKFAGKDIEDPRPREKFRAEGARLLDVLARGLGEKDWIAGRFSIADIAIAPWLQALEFYGTQEAVGWTEQPTLRAYLKRFLDRPKVQAGLNVPPRDG